MKDIKAWLNLPQFFQRKIIASAAVAIFFGGISVVLYFLTADRMQMLLGCILFLACLGKALTLWLCAAGEHYYVLTGNCMLEKRNSPLRLKRVTIKDADGKETSILIDRKLRIQDGQTYRFYFQETYQVPLGSEPGKQNLYEHSLIGVEPFLTDKANEN